jgi:hypothetical protein
MTIVIALKCSDSIVMASDSQTTDEHGHKRTDTKKIHEIAFLNGSALIAASGSATLAARTVELLKSKAASTEIINDETVSALAVETIRQVRNDQVTLYPPSTYSPEQWKKYFLEQEPLEIVIASYFASTPCLHKVSIDNCVDEKITGNFIAIGCGADLGEFLMLELSGTAPDTMLGTVLTAYAVETVIKHNAFCDQPTTIGWIRPKVEGFNLMPNPCILPPNRVEDLVKGIEQANYRIKASRAQQFRNVLQEIADQAAKRFMEFQIGGTEQQAIKDLEDFQQAKKHLPGEKPDGLQP